VRIAKDFTILDVGGGGRTIQKLATAAAQVKVYGVDYADGGVAASRAKSAKLTQAGRLGIQPASVSQLPFSEEKFNLVMAVETQYYRPDLLKDQQEIRRVLKPGGRLIVIAESYKKASHATRRRHAMKLVGSADLGVDDSGSYFRRRGTSMFKYLKSGRKDGFVCWGKKAAP
jgi:ubiquinone/menaquinone biosynthesis C-methylase UbiE